MHPCPCCGFTTLPSRDYYDLCPVCWWEDDGVEPWEVSGPNGETLVEAQQRFLADDRPYRRREGKVRPPKRSEARAADWSPIEVTDELMTRVRAAKAAEQHRWEQQQRQVAREIEEDPEGPLKGYNTAVQALAAEPHLSHRELKDRLRDLGHEHDFLLPAPYLELQARFLKDGSFLRAHPLHATWWLLRYSRPRTVVGRWRELRTGSFAFFG